MNDFLDSFLDDYFAECEEHLTVVRRGLLALEGSVGHDRPDPVVTEELFRSFHSLKGISGMVEHRETELLAHEMESYLRAIREGEVRLTTGGVDTLIEGARLLEGAIAARRNGDPAPDVTVVLAALQQLMTDAPATTGDQPAVDGGAVELGDATNWECLFTPSAALIARGINVNVVRERLRQAGDIISGTPLVMENGAVAFRFVFAGAPDQPTLDGWLADGMVCAPLEGAAGIASRVDGRDDSSPLRPAATLSSGHYVRVDLARLDELMRMIGDMVIQRARLADSINRIEPHVPPAEWRLVQEHAGGIERQLRDLREGVMRVRLVRVGEIFRRMPFVVRDLARETGRKVKVDLSGQETEIDKYLVERMIDPVLHLVRNAVSHGIESVDDRIAAGKPPEGTLSLAASTAGEIVTIEIADDGRGVDAARVIARAQRAGIPVPAEPDDSVLLDLISSPGFSTREQTDRVSGRGFGMAVVRSTVQELGGSMRMVSTPGQGTRFIIDLPLTLAITDALLARVGAQTFAVPQTAVREVIEIDTATIRGLEGSEVAPYRGTALPLVRLSTVLGITGTGSHARQHAFILGAGAGAVGLLVDRILGQREIVVRAIADPLIRVHGVSGATDLGDGRAVLILDAAAIARGAKARGTAIAARAKEIA